MGDGRRRVLVVDDERPFTELLATLLEDEGYAVDVTVASVAGLKCAQQLSEGHLPFTEDTHIERNLVQHRIVHGGDVLSTRDQFRCGKLVSEQ